MAEEDIGREVTLGPGTIVHCVIEGGADGEPEELTEELMGAVGRLLRRG